MAMQEKRRRITKKKQNHWSKQQKKNYLPRNKAKITKHLDHHTSNDKEELTEKEGQQQVTIEQLLERVVNLEMRVKDLKPELSITKNTNGSLKIMVGNQQQCSHEAVHGGEWNGSTWRDKVRGC